MASIVKYQPVSDAYTTYALRTPEPEEGAPGAVRLCVLDGYEYWSIPDLMALPAQPEQITVETVTLTTELLAQIHAASPVVATINDQVVAMIREQYTINDEIKLLRMAPSDESTAYDVYVESCRDWGHVRKTELGLEV